MLMMIKILITHQRVSRLLKEWQQAAPTKPGFSLSFHRGIAKTARSRWRKIVPLAVPYMVPLFLVYVAEYSINHGVLPTLLFPLGSSSFTSLRDFFPAYMSIYQAGVLIARSSLPFYRVSKVYIPSYLQCGNLVLLATHSALDILPNFYVVEVIVFWEGLLGGLVYINTFRNIMDDLPLSDQDFSLSSVSVSDSAGIFVASLLSMPLERTLCNLQVASGRDLCLQS
jgi:battenin